MAGKRQQKREALRKALIDAAEHLIVKGGLRSVKARDLASEAGCALGAIYNAFEDLNALFMEVNGRTFHRLGEAAAESLAAEVSADPRNTLVLISYAYLDFAVEHTNLWRALFDIEMSRDSKAPQWYLEELARLFALIKAPLTRLFPEKTDEQLNLLTRAMFSSVHGIVLLGLENRISGVPRDQVRAMISIVLSEFGKKN